LLELELMLQCFVSITLTQEMNDELPLYTIPLI
jgi:hypothetical protein